MIYHIIHHPFFAFSKIFGHEEFSQKQENNMPRPNEEPQNDFNNPGRIRRNSSGVQERGEAAQRINLETQRRIRVQDESYRARIIRFVLWMHRSVEDIACHLERMVTAVYECQTHEKCPHKEPCFDYWFTVMNSCIQQQFTAFPKRYRFNFFLQGFCSRFLSGFAIQSAIQSASFIRTILQPRKPHLDRTGALLSNSLIFPCIKSGLGLGAMCLSFRLFSCSFRWLQGTDEMINAAASGVMASALGFFLLRPPASAGLYLFFKAAERVISESHR